MEKEFLMHARIVQISDNVFEESMWNIPIRKNFVYCTKIQVGIEVFKIHYIYKYQFSRKKTKKSTKP